MNQQEQTIHTYQRHAAALAAYFNGIGSRTADIDRAFSLLHKANPRVVEIGCGNGRDAKDILTHTPNYVGFDISDGMIALACAAHPTARFEVADLATYTFPPNTDLVFAFASLLHSDREEVSNVLARAHVSLIPGGIFYISLKYGAYGQRLQEDVYGPRLFVYYTPNDIRELAGTGYTTVYEDIHTIGHTEWFTLALKKQPTHRA